RAIARNEPRKTFPAEPFFLVSPVQLTTGVLTDLSELPRHVLRVQKYIFFHSIRQLTSIFHIIHYIK
ncbi:MAG: hypothetical protein J6S48_01245, partial [Bacteroidales bacterium]|nr:hypothetical protein [Bacteroidales bacterium]